MLLKNTISSQFAKEDWLYQFLLIQQKRFPCDLMYPRIRQRENALLFEIKVTKLFVDN